MKEDNTDRDIIIITFEPVHNALQLELTDDARFFIEHLRLGEEE